MKVLKRIIIVIILLAILGLGIIAGIAINDGYNMYKVAIEETSLEDKINNIKSIENYTKLEELPKIYKDAVLAVEDHRFYKHGGVDIISIGRAVIKDIQAMSFVEGGSTITQQVAKNTYFTQEKKITRKIAEVFMAREIEKNYSKDEILEIYLNTSYFGDGYYTVKEASRGYFEKEPIQMTDYESIMLAGIPNAPSVYSPTKNAELSKQRQRQVANAMVKNGYITEKEANKILQDN
ncbi:MAG: transglycosylase domain-containing protein [Clostridia bacterium]|nr:transglycosylase domain-containing protein [Clostridia bacterium]